MTATTEDAHPNVCPHLHYEDPGAAVAWLCEVFGFVERVRLGRGGGNLTARLEGPDGGVVMVSGLDEEFKAWMRSRAPHFEEAAGCSWPLLTHAVTVVVADVDAHHERARRQGAVVLTAPTDQPWGLRTYAALDREGHQWEFATVVASVTPEAWGAVRVDGPAPTVDDTEDRPLAGVEQLSAS